MGNKTKKHLLVLPSQYGKEKAPIYYDERIMLEEFRPFFFGNAIKKYKKYAQATLYVENLNLLAHPFAMQGMLYWLSDHPCLMDSQGKVKEINAFSVVQSAVMFFVESIACVFFKKKVLHQLNILDCPQGTGPHVNKNFDVLKKIIYIRGGQFSSWQPGGSIAHIAGVVNSFVKEGFVVDFWSGHHNSSLNQQVNQFRTLASFIYPNFLVFNELAENDATIYKILRSQKTIKPAFIYQRLSKYNYSGLILARALKTPLILEFNCSDVWVAKHWSPNMRNVDLVEKIELLMLKRADVIIAVSKVLKESLIERGIEAEKVLVCPNGVDPEKFRPDDDPGIIRKRYGLGDKVVFGFVGTFGPWHGTEILARAITRLNFEHLPQNIHFLFVGDGELRSLCEKIIAEAGFSDMCTFTGMVPQGQSNLYQAACDVLVSPHVPNPDGTPFFGSPTKLFEYMAMGKIIIASKLEQIAEVLEDQVTAVLVNPGDVEQLAGVISDIANKMESYRKLGLNARTEVCRHYTWQQHTRKIIQKIKADVYSAPTESPG